MALCRTSARASTRVIYVRSGKPIVPRAPIRSSYRYRFPRRGHPPAARSRHAAAEKAIQAIHVNSGLRRLRADARREACGGPEPQATSSQELRCISP